METQINIQNLQNLLRDLVDQNDIIGRINQNLDLTNEIIDKENHAFWLKDLKDLFEASKKIDIDKENKNNQNFLIKLKNLEEKIKDLL